MSYREPGLVVQDILQSELGLTAGQVMFTNQKYEIPTVGLLIVVSYIGPSKVISNQNEWGSDGAGGLTEIQSLCMLHQLQIDIMAFNNPSGTNDARTRKEEIAMAIHSLFSQSQQELYSMQIARQPGPMMDTSFLEETEILTRYTCTLATTSALQKSKPANYYSDFSRAVPPLLTTNA